MTTETIMIPEDVAALEAAVTAVHTYARDYSLLPERYKRQVVDGGNPQIDSHTIEYVASKKDAWSVAAGVRQSAVGPEQYIEASWRVGTQESGVMDVEISLTLREGSYALKAREGRIRVYWDDNGRIQERYAQFPREHGPHKNLLSFANGAAFTEIGAQELIKGIVRGTILPQKDMWSDKDEILAAMSGLMAV